MYFTDIRILIISYDNKIIEFSDIYYRTANSLKAWCLYVLQYLKYA